MDSFLVNLRLMCAFLIIFIVLVFFAVFIVSERMLSFLDCTVEIKIPVARRVLLFAALGRIVIVRLRFECLFAFSKLEFFFFEHFYSGFFFFSASLLLCVKISDDVELFVCTQNLFSLLFRQRLSDVLACLTDLWCVRDVDIYFLNNFFLSDAFKLNSIYIEILEMTENFGLSSRKYNKILIIVYFCFSEYSLSLFVGILCLNFFLVKFSSPDYQQKISQILNRNSTLFLTF